MILRPWLVTVVTITLCGAVVSGCAGRAAPSPSSQQARAQLQAYWQAMAPTMAGLVSDLDAFENASVMVKAESSSLGQVKVGLQENDRSMMPAVAMWARKAAAARPPLELVAAHARFVRALDGSLAAMRRRIAARRPITAQLAAIWAAGRRWQSAVERYAAPLGVPLPVPTSTPMLLPTVPKTG